jgi:hypothetical protein
MTTPRNGELCEGLFCLVPELFSRRARKTPRRQLLACGCAVFLLRLRQHVAGAYASTAG